MARGVGVGRDFGFSTLPKICGPQSDQPKKCPPKNFFVENIFARNAQKWVFNKNVVPKKYRPHRQLAKNMWPPQNIHLLRL